MGSFNIQINKSNKIFNAEVEGTFSPEDGMKSIEAYQKEISTITPSEYEIHIDCTKLNVSHADTLPILEGCFQLYKKDGFKEIKLTISKNPILSMQLKRIGRRVELTNFEIIEA